MQPNKIKEWVKANKLLSAIIVGAIIVVIILYLGAYELSSDEIIFENNNGEVAAPEIAPEEVPPEEPVETEGGTV